MSTGAPLDVGPGDDRSSGVLPLALGIAALVVGVWLLTQPFRSVSTLVWLSAAAFVLGGLEELISPDRSRRAQLSRIIGGGWIALGIVIAVWPDITLFELAITVGVGVVAGGLSKVVVALASDGDDRILLALSGLTNVIVGILALTWPAATVLVLAVLVGFRTVVVGIGQLWTFARQRSKESTLRRRPRWLRLTGAIAAFALASAGVVVSVLVHRASPDEPGPFYTAPSPLPDDPMGTLIRSEVIDGFHTGATTYRVLYLSTGYDGEPTAVSGIVVVPDGDAPPEGRKVIVFTHGTVGVAPRCGPSVIGKGAGLVYEGLDEFVAAGYVVAATDYQGLGTDGPHPYLVGESEAMNALDSMRAARNLPEAQAGTDFAVWGHSQGGHASLFTGQTAATYAPELNLVGVAAGAPVPDLVALFQFNVGTTIGKILISMALQSWSKVYSISLDDIVTESAQPALRRIAEGCLYDPAQIVASVPSALLLDLTFLRQPPWEVEPWKSIVVDNDPGGRPIGVPVLLTQGTADPIVDPSATEAWAAERCAADEDVEVMLLDGVAHVEAGHEAAPAVATWIADRFAGVPASGGCNPG